MKHLLNDVAKGNFLLEFAEFTCNFSDVQIGNAKGMGKGACKSGKLGVCLLRC